MADLSNEKMKLNTKKGQDLSGKSIPDSENTILQQEEYVLDKMIETLQKTRKIYEAKQQQIPLEERFPLNRNAILSMRSRGYTDEQIKNLLEL